MRREYMWMLTLLLGLSGGGAMAEESGRYPWCSQRIAQLNLQQERAEASGDQHRLERLEKRLERTYARCGLTSSTKGDSPRSAKKTKRGNDRAIERRDAAPESPFASLYRERQALERRILKQRELLIRQESALEKALVVGDHLQVKLLKIDLERDRAILSLYETELEQIASRLEQLRKMKSPRPFNDKPTKERARSPQAQ